MKPEIDDIKDLMENLAIPFYQVERDMDLPISPRRPENDAEHSWSLALLCCSLAPHVDKNLDLGKICQFAVVHDLVEVYAQDTSIWADEELLSSKEERESDALEQISTRFSAFPWIAETIREYESKQSPEANFVWAADKMIGLIIRYIDEGKFFQEKGITLAKFNNHLSDNKKKAHAHPGIAKYYDELRKLFDEHPEYFAK